MYKITAVDSWNGTIYNRQSNRQIVSNNETLAYRRSGDCKQIYSSRDNRDGDTRIGLSMGTRSRLDRYRVCRIRVTKHNRLLTQWNYVVEAKVLICALHA